MAAPDPAGARLRARARARSTSGSQGTSMASPHAVGVAALIVAEFGRRDRHNPGLTLDPRITEQDPQEDGDRHAVPGPGAVRLSGRLGTARATARARRRSTGSTAKASSTPRARSAPTTDARERGVRHSAAPPARRASLRSGRPAAADHQSRLSHGVTHATVRTPCERMRPPPTARAPACVQPVKGQRNRITLPVTKPAAGEHSQRITSATSAGCAIRVATLARTSSVTQPVSVIGGCTTFAVIP